MGAEGGTAIVRDPARLWAVEQAERAAVAGRLGLERVTRLATRLLDVEFGFLSLVHQEDEQLLAVARPDAGAMPATLPIGQSVCVHLVETGLPLVVPDLGAHPELRQLVEVQALGLRSYAGVPLTTDDGVVLGGLCVGSREPRAWTADDLALLADLAGSVSTELNLRVTLDRLEQVQLAERQRADRQGSLHRVAAAVARAEPPEQVLQRVSDEIVALLGVQGALVVRWEPDDGPALEASSGVGAAGPVGLQEVGPLLDVLARTGLPAHHEDAGTASAGVPVHLAGRQWGAIVAVGGRSSAQEVLDQLAQLADLVRLVVANTEAQRRLVALARTDPLTGVANRRAFDERLQEELARAARYGGPLVLALVDVDRFKQVNDEHGHEAGDRVLQALTARLGPRLRGADLLARLGGDEFAVLLPETDGSAARAVLERGQAALRERPLAGLPVTASVGAAVLQRGQTGGELYRAADAALYRAKQDGRDRLHLG